MASEIDEAAAEKHCRWIIANPGAFAGKDYAAHNSARAALAWKARAEKWDALIRPESILPLQAAKDWRERAEELQDTLGLAQLAAQTWKHRAKAAEAERDKANAKLRVMDSRMNQVHAALLASMSDEQLATSVKAR